MAAFYTLTGRVWWALAAVTLVAVTEVVTGAVTEAVTEASRGRGSVIVAFETPDQEQFQYGRPGEAVFGAFSWRSPEGHLFIYRYVADAAGYRVRSETIPVDSQGVAANGEQVFPRTPDGEFIFT
ncbi:uncharacterized protein [Procambarus clarkii]|uniref:uncharacterized protein isoform X1 n=1 Tax=Procambarus clarkii TaxID=6728 RepID=UPI001E6712DC|nr:uncharacterized protein LOC123757530 [Procambarus clarkii]